MIPKSKQEKKIYNVRIKKTTVESNCLCFQQCNQTTKCPMN